MKNTLTYILFISLFISNNSVQSQDKVTIQTDRTLFITGELIQFQAIISFDKSLDSFDYSETLYVELLDEEGKSQKSGKFIISGDYCKGSIKIPNQSQSATYYLRAYTRWQRNSNPKHFAYIPLKIINTKRGLKFKPTPIKQTPLTEKPQKSSFKINLLNDTFATRSLVKASITYSTDAIDSSKPLIIRSVPKGSYTASKLIEIDSEENTSLTNTFIPETRNQSISGSVLDSINGDGVNQALVSVTLLINPPIHLSKYTDSNGRFYISLPKEFKTHEIFVSTSHYSDRRLRLLVDNDFCSRNITFNNSELLLDSTELNLIKELDLNQKISQAFNIANNKISEVQKNDNASFLGNIDKTIITNEYIRLPKLEDYFIELFHSISIKKQKGEKFIKIADRNNIKHVLSPLVLVDGLALMNYSAIWQMSASKIEKIEVIRSAIARGDVTYGGLVSISTYDNDFGGINLPKSGLFFDYAFYKPIINIAYVEPQKNIPTALNTLYFGKEDLLEGSTINIEFFTGEMKGEFEISLSAYSLSGDLVEQSLLFYVK